MTVSTTLCVVSEDPVGVSVAMPADLPVEALRAIAVGVLKYATANGADLESILRLLELSETMRESYTPAPFVVKGGDG